MNSAVKVEGRGILVNPSFVPFGRSGVISTPKRLDSGGHVCEEEDHGSEQGEATAAFRGQTGMRSSTEQVISLPRAAAATERDLSVEKIVIVLAAFIALLSARPYAGSWNDGGRLASVEAMVDHHTFSIDQSVFVDVKRVTGIALPYPADNQNLIENGTRDKLLINGHYYSDKPMVQSVLMAGLYTVLQQTTGLIAKGRPDLFAYFMTLLTSGVAYVFATWGIARLATKVGLTRQNVLLITASFGLATAALPYVCHVNQHIVLLALAVMILLDGYELTLAQRTGEGSIPRVLRIGLCAGLGYAIDFGAGAPLVLLAGILIAYQCRSMSILFVFALALFPSIAMYHAINYAIGGSLMPANANVAYLAFPGSPFSSDNATGGWKHANAFRLALYGGDLLLGKRGFLEHNVPLLLLCAAGLALARRRLPERTILLFGLSWSVMTWMVYASGSNNLSGACYSIRWFVPLLAPAFLAIAVLLRERPELQPHLVLLSGWGGVMAGLGWWEGPWSVHMVPLYWGIVAGMVVSWVALTYYLSHRSVDEDPSVLSIPAPLALPPRRRMAG